MTDGGLPRSFDTWTADEAFGSAPLPPLVAQLAAVALDAAQEAGTILVNRGRGSGDRFAVVTGLETKVSDTDMVSDVDRASEEAVAALISKRRPDDALVGEEGADRPGTSGIRWVVDPLDGTTNYLFGIPQFSVSIAAEDDRGAVVGVVLDPSRHEVWAAASGYGSYLNGQRLTVPDGRSPLHQALVATGFGYRPERRRWQAAVVAHVLPRVRDIRRLGSAALDLAWMGGGRVDAYYEWGLNAWDMSAGSLVASEAGAVVRVLGHRLVVAAGPSLIDPFCRLLEDAGGLDAQPGPEPTDW